MSDVLSATELAAYYQTFEDATVPERFKALLRTYYTEHFTPRPLLKVVGLRHFNFREWGFIYHLPKKPKDRAGFDRNINFETPALLGNFMATTAPAHAYVGGVFTRHLTRGRGVLMGDVRRRELGFDIDIGDFDMIRKKICKCAGKYVCAQCLELTKEATLFAVDTLREDFGFRKFKIIFSGGGGFHIWVQDAPAGMLSEGCLANFPPMKRVRWEKTLRLSIVNYLSPIEVTKRGKVVIHDPVIRARSLRDRIFRTVLRNFLTKSPNSVLLESGLKLEDIATIKARIAREGYSPDIYTWIINSKFRSSTSKKKFDTTFLKYRYPRYDKGPTQDLVRVLRVPHSIHGKTGNVCTIVKDLAGFTIGDIPTIFNYVSV